ncbi:EXOSTOSIN FAMILY PROTEIN [Salix viminalis]|uniref:EXOSTOSIN FAMILY PROTEIN n=1 Tax=Salix viminalis TaxID=40686 RepID=A0A9Q0NYC1_SALVM|nr:EXOSTOSIN FAMILY PROTEIN [Salix viminalis]
MPTNSPTICFVFRNTCRDTDNLTSDGSPVHRLIDQHSVDYWLWADLIGPESVRLLKTLETECSRYVFFSPPIILIFNFGNK